MKKSQRIAQLVATLPVALRSSLDPRYVGYFTCFNAGQYYEAHDVLEDLWLEDRTTTESGFYKGLIQFAGAFVHLKKQHERPLHPTDGVRLAPAARLFQLASRHLFPFAPHHQHLAVAHLCALADQLSAAIATSNFRENPWHPSKPPQLNLE